MSINKILQQISKLKEMYCSQYKSYSSCDFVVYIEDADAYCSFDNIHDLNQLRNVIVRIEEIDCK